MADGADFYKLGCGYFYYYGCVRVWLHFDPELWGSPLCTQHLIVKIINTIAYALFTLYWFLITSHTFLSIWLQSDYIYTSKLSTNLYKYQSYCDSTAHRWAINNQQFGGASCLYLQNSSRWHSSRRRRKVSPKRRYLLIDGIVSTKAVILIKATVRIKNTRF